MKDCRKNTNWKNEVLEVSIKQIPQKRAKQCTLVGHFGCSSEKRAMKKNEDLKLNRV